MLRVYYAHEPFSCPFDDFYYFAFELFFASQRVEHHFHFVAVEGTVHRTFGDEYRFAAVVGDEICFVCYALSVYCSCYVSRCDIGNKLTLRYLSDYLLLCHIEQYVADGIFIFFSV